MYPLSEKKALALAGGRFLSNSFYLEHLADVRFSGYPYNSTYPGNITSATGGKLLDESTKMRQTLASFFKKIGSEAPEGANVFDLMTLVQAGNTAKVLRTLTSIFQSGEEPERLLGGMLWAWSNKIKGRVPPVVYKKGLLLLQEADMALKRSKFPDRENALEILVVKLSSLTRSRA